MAGLKDFPKFGALAGLKILDSGSNIAGPLGGGLLAECGATVIHFEGPRNLTTREDGTAIHRITVISYPW